MLSRPGKPQGFHYLNHQSVDGNSGIITDVFITPANVDDCVPYVERIKYQIDKYKLSIKEVGIDKGYDYIEIHKEMYDLGIKTYTPLKDNEKVTCNVFPMNAFAYDSAEDVYICPNGNKLRYASINKSQRKKIYSISRRICKNCPLKPKCMSGSLKSRALHIPFFQQEATIQRMNYRTARYYEVQRLRRIYCEGNFAIQKDNYNLRRTKKRGNKQVTEHCLFSAIALNLKRLIKYLNNNPLNNALNMLSYFLLPKNHILNF